MISPFPKGALVATAMSLVAAAAHAQGVGASLLTQRHPFYIELANAMRDEAAKKGIPLEVSIANQDLSKMIEKSRRAPPLGTQPCDQRRNAKRQSAPTFRHGLDPLSAILLFDQLP